MKSLRLSVFFFSVILVLAVSQVALAQPPTLVLIYSPNDRTAGNTTPFLAWEGEKSDSVQSYLLKIFNKDNSSDVTTLIHKSPNPINKIDKDEKRGISTL